MQKKGSKYNYNIDNTRNSTFPPLVRRRIGERGRREAYTLVGRVEDGIEALEERLAVDEVEALASGCTEAVDDEVHVARRAADSRVEGTGPRLGIGSEHETASGSCEGQRLHISKCRGAELEETRGLVQRGFRRLFIRRKCTGRNQDQRRSGVDNARGGGLDDSSAVSNALVYAPELVSRGSSRERSEGNAARELRAVGTAESQLAVGDAVRSRGIGNVQLYLRSTSMRARESIYSQYGLVCFCGHWNT